MTIVSCCASKGAARFACARGGCPECMEALLRENTGLVRYMVIRQGWGQVSCEEMLQEGQIGLWQAILHFDPERGTAFSSYASIAIRNRVWIAAEKSRRAEGWQERAGAADFLERVATSQIRQAVSAALEGLPERLRQLLTRHYGLDDATPQNLAEIGRDWGLSRERVRQLRNHALVRLRLPALSIRLRELCERQTEADYRQALRQNQAWLRKSRGRT
jgi:RNA polymerase sigma factor (sigma-70 family)